MEILYNTLYEVYGNIFYPHQKSKLKFLFDMIMNMISDMFPYNEKNSLYLISLQRRWTISESSSEKNIRT